jgi:hypothetical protein
MKKVVVVANQYNEDEEDFLFEIESINDEMKMEHISKVFGKYSLQELETLLPDK